MVAPDVSDTQQSLEGRVVIVVGSTQGIGRAVAETLAAHGAAVVVNGRDGEAAEAVAAAIRTRRPDELSLQRGQGQEELSLQRGQNQDEDVLSLQRGQDQDGLSLQRGHGQEELSLQRGQGQDGLSLQREPGEDEMSLQRWTERSGSGPAAIAVAGSAADPDVAQALLDRAVEAWGGVDALIVCAGTAEPQGSSILNITSDEFNALIDAHLRTTFEACRVVAPHLVERGGGAIVTTSSHAFTGTYGGTGYPAGKGAVTSLTYALAAELAEHRIRVNAVCPGATTRLSTGDEYREHIEALHARGLLDDATRHGSLDPGPPEFVAQLYAYLASDLAEGVTGEVFAGAGGYLGRFPRPEAEFLTWRDHHANPPWTLEEIADLLGSR